MVLPVYKGLPLPLSHCNIIFTTAAAAHYECRYIIADENFPNDPNINVRFSFVIDY
jgi:hypothetical protein